MSGHFIHPAGVSCLRRLGLLEDLEALGAPAQETMTLDFGPIVLSGRPEPAPDGTAAAYAPRRYRFDPMLADAAVAAGASLREGVSFVEPLVEGGRVAGIRTRNAAGRTRTSAPGWSSARTASARGWRRRSALRSMTTGRPPPACYYAYWSGFDAVGHPAVRARWAVLRGRAHQ